MENRFRIYTRTYMYVYSYARIVRSVVSPMSDSVNLVARAARREGGSITGDARERERDVYLLQNQFLFFNNGENCIYTRTMIKYAYIRTGGDRVRMGVYRKHCYH